MPIQLLCGQENPKNQVIYWSIWYADEPIRSVIKKWLAGHGKPSILLYRGQIPFAVFYWWLSVSVHLSLGIRYLEFQHSGKTRLRSVFRYQIFFDHSLPAAGSKPQSLRGDRYVDRSNWGPGDTALARSSKCLPVFLTKHVPALREFSSRCQPNLSTWWARAWGVYLLNRRASSSQPTCHDRILSGQYQTWKVHRFL